MAQRIKGLETRIIMTGPTGLETALADVHNMEITSQMEILSQGYLGESSERKDDIFRGVAGKMEMHLEQAAYLSFIDQVERRAQRRTASNVRFNVTTTLLFPNGTEAPRIVIEDVFFGEIQTTIGGRDEYVNLSIEFAAQTYRKLF